MKITRRQILQGGGAVAAGLIIPTDVRAQSPTSLLPATPMAGALFKNRFTDTLAIPPVALPVADPRFPGADYYEMGVREFPWNFGSYISGSKVWGYTIGTPNGAPLGRQGYLGGLIIARKGRPVKVHFENYLTGNGLKTGTPLDHLIKAVGARDAVDDTIAGSPALFTGQRGGALHNRICTHLHGGELAWDSDGHPLSWYSNNAAANGNHGSYYQVANGQINTYPNNQSARLVWYHDHAMSLTRLNAYAGIATGYVIRDQAEADLVEQGKLPPFIETTLLADGKGPDQVSEWPLVIQEKMFNLDNSLYYHTYYDQARWGTAGGPAGQPPYPSCIPEFFGDIGMVNGVPWPKLPVRQQLYRFRMLNGSQARFYNLALYYAKTASDGTAIPDLTRPGPQFYQIGTEGGFLPAPVRVTKLLLAPAERADVLIDFSNVPAGTRLILYGAAPAPYPAGDPLNQYMDTTGFSRPATIMAFDVAAGKTYKYAKTLPASLPAVTKLANPNKTLGFTLNEGADEYGRLSQLIGSFTPTNPADGGFGAPFVAPPGAVGAGLPIVYETHRNGDTEMWTIVNNTGDTHPMHFHLEDVQIVSRQGIDLNAFNTTGAVKYVGPVMGPDPNEQGWKETVRMYPGQATRVMMKFNSGYTGHYVWHCHILEHEEHDMMHEFEVV